MSRLVVPHQLLVESAERTRDCSTQMTSARRALERRADDLFGGGWSGEAATLFAQGMREWEAGAEQVIQTLAEMAELIATADSEFRVEDAGNSAAVQASAAGIDAAAGSAIPLARPASGLNL